MCLWRAVRPEFRRLWRTCSRWEQCYRWDAATKEAFAQPVSVRAPGLSPAAGAASGEVGKLSKFQRFSGSTRLSTPWAGQWSKSSPATRPWCSIPKWSMRRCRRTFLLPPLSAASRWRTRPWRHSLQSPETPFPCSTAGCWGVPWRAWCNLAQWTAESRYRTTFGWRTRSRPFESDSSRGKGTARMTHAPPSTCPGSQTPSSTAPPAPLCPSSLWAPARPALAASAMDCWSKRPTCRDLPSCCVAGNPRNCSCWCSIASRRDARLMTSDVDSTADGSSADAGPKRR